MLVLNEQIKELFKSQGLPECTITASYNLCLIGPCGQQLFTLKYLGIKSLKTQKEKDIVFNIVTKFIQDNKTVLKEYFSLKQQLKDTQVSAELGYINSTTTGSLLSLSSNSEYYRLGISCAYEDGSIRLTNNNSYSIADLKAIIKASKQLPAVVTKAIQDTKAAKPILDRINQITRDFNSCK